jgi:hypothetical protein
MGGRVSVSIPKDERGFVGRECPNADCEGYFKIKPGTGLTGTNLPCHCPYCGHTAGHDHFWTREQIEYAKSVAARQVADAVLKDLKQLEFKQRPRGPFGIGISLELKRGQPVPIRYYREKRLETEVVCDNCTLLYAIYGLFAFCPDCRAHNSLQILLKNLDLVLKQVDLASNIGNEDLRRHLIEDALENCVSAFDGFGRETCRVRGSKSTDPKRAESFSFQNVDRASERLRDLFGVDFQSAVDASEWSAVRVAFMKRHVVAHRSAIVDDQYLVETGDPMAVVGRRIPLDEGEVRRLVDLLRSFGRTLVGLLPQP